MRLTCPACGAVASLDVLIGHQGARDAVLAALRLPAPLGDLVIQYVGLFRPAPRQLSMDRLARLLTELLPLIQAGKIERSGRLWAAPLEAWRAALEDMIAKRDKLTLPLKTHGYLLEIIAGAANRAEAQVETQREQTRAYAYSSERMGTGAPVPARACMPEDVRDQLKRLVKGACDGDGK